MKLNLVPFVACAAIATAAVSCKESSDVAQPGGPSAGVSDSNTAAGPPDAAVAFKLRWPVGGRFGRRMEVHLVEESRK